LSNASAFLSLLLLLGACKPPPEGRQHMPGTDPARGLEVVNHVGCGSCHTIPGLRWPEGSVGPSLEGFAERTLIPGTAMPAMPITEKESRDVAAYLYAIGAR
jgi:mono/diheme cytochrome c family protein